MRTHYFDLLKNSVNIQIIIGLLTFRLITVFLDKILFPLINIYLLDDDAFRRLNLFIGKKNKQRVFIEPVEKNPNVKIEIGIGYFLKELIIFFSVFTIYYFLVNSQSK